MRCHIFIGATDETTYPLVRQFQPRLDILNRILSKDYGGVMEHLAIEIELCPMMGSDRPIKAFRFQKRVTSSSVIPLVGKNLAKTLPDQFNVGHFSVRPDYDALMVTPPNALLESLLCLVYDGTVDLERRSKSLGGFDGSAFRADLLSAIRSLDAPSPAPAN